MSWLHTSRVAVAAVGSAALVLAGCGGGQSGSGPDTVSASSITGKIDTSKVKKTVRVGVDNPYYLFQEDLFVAQDKGYFRQYGIDKVGVQLAENPLPGLIGSSLDFVLFDTDTVLAAAEKSQTDIRFLGTYLGIEANILGCHKGIDSAADVRGKTITGGQSGSRNDFILQQLLKHNGLDPDKDVKRVSTDGQSNERLQAVLNGKLDCATLQPRHRSLLEDAGGKFVFEESRPVPQNGWGAMGAFVDANPDTTAAFLAATLKARHDIENMSNKDYVLDLAKRRGFTILPPYADAYEFENLRNHTRDGGFAAKDMDTFVQEDIELKVLPPGTDWRKHTDLKALWTAQKNLGLALNPPGSAVEK